MLACQRDERTCHGDPESLGRGEPERSPATITNNIAKRWWGASKITYLQRVASLECTPNEYGGEGDHVTTRGCSVSDGDRTATERRTSIQS